ncbi:hypothetical protein D9M70_501370 [compost metagenome]
MTPGGRSQPRKKSRLHMGLAESEGRPAAKGQRDIRCRCNGWRCRQAGRDIGARAVAGLDQSVAREMLIGRNDHIAAYAKLGGKLAARRQTGAGRQQTVDDGGTQPTVDPKRLVADRAIKFDRREGRSLSWKRSGWHEDYKSGPISNQSAHANLQDASLKGTSRDRTFHARLPRRYGQPRQAPP